MSRIKKSGYAAALAVTLVGGFEGVRQVAYPDPATKGPPWTICYGHTQGVRPGDRMTMDECKALLRRDLDIYASGIERCVHVALPDKRYVALVSLAYNIGVARACKSSAVRLINAGRTREGCAAFMNWTTAAGIEFPGLVTRRKRERAYCEDGL